MVPGENAQSPGVDRQNLRQTELGGEVGDPLPPRDELPRRRMLRLGQVLLGQPAGQRQEVFLVARVLGGPPQAFGRYLPEEANRVSAGALPGLGVEHLEESSQVRPPRPPEVVREGEERKELFGDAGNPKRLFENGCQLAG